MRLRLGISTVLAMLIAAFPVLAEPPPYVTGLLAEEINGEIYVGWTSQPDADVAYYRVFYSFESILENEGLFDGFEETDGPMNSHIIKDPPPVEKLYIAVIGVSSQEEDINMFVEEVLVDLDGGDLPEDDNWTEDDWPEDDSWTEDDWPENDIQPEDQIEFPEEDAFGSPTIPVKDIDTFQDALFEQSDEPPLANDTLRIKEEKLLLPGAEPPRQVSATDEPVVQESETLRLLSAKTNSPTEVLLKFSGPISVDPDRAPEAFSIIDSVGNQLAITYMSIKGNDAVVTTVEQTRERIYEFNISEPAFSPEGLPLDPMDRSAFFLAHPNSSASTTQPSRQRSVQSTEALGGIENFKIEATALANGYFDVSARWDIAGDRNEIAYYIINQTRDGGQSFGDPQTVTSDAGGVELANVTPGPFGIALSFVHANGTASPVVFKNINLGPGVTTIPTGSATFQNQLSNVVSLRSDELSQTGGMTAAISIIIVGGVMGWRKMRRKLVV